LGVSVVEVTSFSNAGMKINQEFGWKKVSSQTGRMTEMTPFSSERLLDFGGFGVEKDVTSVRHLRLAA
jgi:hypothetical protein